MMVYVADAVALFFISLWKAFALMVVVALTEIGLEYKVDVERG